MGTGLSLMSYFDTTSIMAEPNGVPVQSVERSYDEGTLIWAASELDSCTSWVWDCYTSISDRMTSVRRPCLRLKETISLFKSVVFVVFVLVYMPNQQFWNTIKLKADYGRGRRGPKIIGKDLKITAIKALISDVNNTRLVKLSVSVPFAPIRYFRSILSVWSSGKYF